MLPSSSLCPPMFLLYPMDLFLKSEDQRFLSCTSTAAVFWIHSNSFQIRWKLNDEEMPHLSFEKGSGTC